jgi:alpha-glucosidase
MDGIGVSRSTGRVTGSQWWQGGVVYQIYPLSWADSNGDGYGDLPGITANLDHLAGAADSLGVDAIWLSPIYRSPMVDFGYDISDHCDVDPRFGTLADADRLLSEAHRRGLRVLLDYVPNHSSDQHPWFEQSRSSRGNPFRDWYVWADSAPDGGPPNNWLSAFERVGGAWTFDEQTGQWYLHSYTSQQPDLNWRNPATRQAMHDVLRFWLDRGVDGFRIDVPHRIAKDPLLRDNPASVAMLRRASQVDERRHRCMDHPDAHEMLRGIRRVVDAYPDTVLVGEVGIYHPERRLAYHGTDGDELQLIFNFGFWSNPWCAEAFRAAGARLAEQTDIHRWPTHALSNHDISRHASRHGTGSRARVAAVLLLTLPGTTFLYYGEEIGATDAAVPDALASDPDGRDRCRAPMQWRSGPGAGFSTGSAWLAVDGHDVPVSEQRLDSSSLLNLYRHLLRLRRSDARLREGGYRQLECGPDVYAYLRDSVLVALNFAGEPRPAHLDPHSTAATGRVLVGSGQRSAGASVAVPDLVLHGDEALVLDLGRGARQ